MKSVKENYYQKEILRCLIDGDVLSTRQIAESVGLSEKSVRNKIENINYMLKEQDMGLIDKKPRVGIWLESTPMQKEKLQSFLMIKDTVSIKDDEKDRVQEVLRILFKLRPWQTVTTQNLADELYLSTPTVLKVLKEAEIYLQQYDIQLVNKRSVGYHIEYNENMYRIALKDLILSDFSIEHIREELDYYFSNLDTKLIQKCIIETENEWNYRFTDESFYEILIYCCLAYQRRDISVPKIKDNGEIQILQKYNEYPFTVALFQKIQDKFHILFSNDDVMFLAVQIMCSKFIDISSMNETLQQVEKYDEKLIRFVEKTIKVVGNILDVDLTKDEKLRDSLIFHLRPTIFRIRYGTPQSNLMLDYIKKEYKNVFRATWSASIMFEDYFDLKLTEDEVGYIVLYIQAALERQEKQFSIVLLADSSRGHAELIISRIHKLVPEIKKVKVMSAHDFRIKPDKEADLVVAPKELKIDDPRLTVIPNLLSESGIMMLMNALNNMDKKHVSIDSSFSPECFQMFDPSLIFVNQDVKDVESLLHFMSSAMEMRGYVSNGFYDSVIEREKVTSTSIGNGIALPHGAQSEVIENKVAIATLKNSLIWEGDKVNIVFLLGVRMITPEEIERTQQFYKDFISLVEKDENISKILGMETNIDLYKFLIS